MSATAFHTLSSRLDASVNHVRPHSDGGKVEARFVQRRPDRFIVYISSMTGCDKACRFCHLTQTGQLMNTCLSRQDMVEQARLVLDSPHAIKAREQAKLVHFNFMARGEPLSNPEVDRHLFSALKDLAVERGLKCRVKISTIMPMDLLPERLTSLVDEDSPPVDIYYSLYSLDKSFRKRWIPRGIEPEKALNSLAAFRSATGNRVILHWALIDGVNDKIEDARAVVRAVDEAGLDVDFNLVRYNPADARSREADETAITAYLEVISRSLRPGHRVRRIPRVGLDVAASCGMFVSSASERGTDSA